LLHSYTGQDDFVIGTPSPSGRKRSELHNLLGYFLTPVALRFRLTTNVTFRELLRQAHRLTLEAISNDGLPVEVLAEKLSVQADASRNPLFTVATSLQPTTPKLDIDWTVSSMDISSGGAPWDLYLAFIDGDEGMFGRVQYNPDLFETKTIARFMRDYQDLAQIVGSGPDKRILEMAS
jgi:non-ribosomal peptide synthetase component F